MRSHFIYVTVIIVLLYGCSDAMGQTELPNQVPVKLTDAEEMSYVKDWSRVKKNAPHIEKMFHPDNPAFTGAVLWYGSIETKNPEEAAMEALKAEGLKGAKIKSIAETNVEFLRQIDGHPDARTHMLVVDGTLNGKPARANVYTWFGTALDKSGKTTMTHAFLAPLPVYEALGGIAVNSVYNLEAQVAEGTNMLEIGRMTADESTAKMAQLFNSWAANYIQTNILIMQMMGQTMAISQQTLNSMQSYNNALSQCAGWDCSITQGADGTWTATPD